jgi:N-acetylglucosamine kinase-like BadF-type ATPase
VRRPALLAVDGGGSKTDVALLRKDGRVLGAVRVAGANWDGRGERAHHEELALAPLDAAIAEAAREAGLPERRPVAEVGSFCLAGADLPVDDRRLLAQIRRDGWVDDPILRNDTFAVLRAGTERTWGVAVVCGYGTNCAGVAPDGRTARFPAIGPISGDWGGGNEIGSLAAWHAFRSQDGRGPKTSLQRSVPAFFGLRTPRQLMEAVYFDRLGEERLAQLAPVVFGDASEGDAVARNLIDRQADEVVLMATTAIRRLRMRELDVDVVLGGGIFRNGDAAFFDRIRDGLTTIAPRARMRRLTDPPLIGAALIGLDELGATKAARATARASLTHERLTGHTRGRKEA